MRLCSLHGRRLNKHGDCPTCLRYEAEAAEDETLPVVTLNAISQRWLDREIARGAMRRKPPAPSI